MSKKSDKSIKEKPAAKQAKAGQRDRGRVECQEALEAHRLLIGARACDMTACQTPANSESSEQIQVPAAFGAKLPSGD
jgi:hypothetical protein